MRPVTATLLVALFLTVAASLVLKEEIDAHLADKTAEEVGHLRHD